MQHVLFVTAVCFSFSRHDLACGVLLMDADIKKAVAASHNYSAWVRRHHVAIVPSTDHLPTMHDDLLATQARFGYSHEDVEMVIRPLASSGGEAVWSMGDDTPLAVLSQQPRPLICTM